MGLLHRSAVELLTLLRNKQISPIELAQLHIDQISALNPKLNAILNFDPESVLAQARRAGSGILAGLPVTVKSTISTAGNLCEVGSVLNRGRRATEDAVLVRRLRQSGAVILGNTNCPEFLMAYETDNSLYGRTPNPWNLDYSAGGSSGGESAAIAAGMSAAGLGSDSGGSVRQPAHATGICSLKPTPGRLPGTGHVPECVGPFSILGAVGPMARTIDDVALLFRTLSGASETDPVGAPVAQRDPSLDDFRQLTIAVFEDDGIVPVTPETRAAVRSAASALMEAGFNVVPYRPKSLEKLRMLWEVFFVRCGARFVEQLIADADDISPTLRDFLMRARKFQPLSADELLFAWAEIDVVRGQMLEEMTQYPVLLCPVSAVPAFKHGERSWMVDGTEVEYLDAMRYTQWFNMLAAPAAVVPVGSSPEGLPIGVQIAARPYHDEEAIAIAQVVDRAFGYRIPTLS